eukprot:Sspe_Gene.58283::Locus_31965_Transcript_1_1_Confidence_1.000_Length_1450::g.58283::m.58283
MFRPISDPLLLLLLVVAWAGARELTDHHVMAPFEHFFAGHRAMKAQQEWCSAQFTQECKGYLIANTTLARSINHCKRIACDCHPQSIFDERGCSVPQWESCSISEQCTPVWVKCFYDNVIDRHYRGPCEGLRECLHTPEAHQDLHMECLEKVPCRKSCQAFLSPTSEPDHWGYLHRRGHMTYIPRSIEMTMLLLVLLLAGFLVALLLMYRSRKARINALLEARRQERRAATEQRTPPPMLEPEADSYTCRSCSSTKVACLHTPCFCKWCANCHPHAEEGEGCPGCHEDIEYIIDRSNVFIGSSSIGATFEAGEENGQHSAESALGDVPMVTVDSLEDDSTGETEPMTASAAEEEVTVRTPPPGANENNCVVCFESVSQVVFVPCRHMAACHDCAERIATVGRSSGHCHLCRKDIQFMVNLSNIPEFLEG